MKLLKSIFFLICFILSNSVINAQTIYNYTGSKKDITLPDDIDSGEYFFKLRGGDGGWAKAGDCEAGGGNGAKTEFKIRIGDGNNEIPGGTKLRFIVGGKGTNQDRSGSNNVGARGSGGGGTAVLARIDNEWVILGVAGGGGGAYRGTALGFCVDNDPGQGGRSSTSGGDGGGNWGGDGGSNGNGGGGGGDPTFGWTDFAGGGGGAHSDGTGSNDLDQEDHQLAGKKGLNNGGNGGNWNGTHVGGWGFGGGGAGDQGGGGGGGYSGGGGGGEHDNGGGGGSYTHSTYTFATSITSGNSDMNTENGYIKMYCPVVIEGFDYINELCASTDQGRIQFDYIMDDVNCDSEEPEWSLSPLNGWNYLGDGIFRSVRTGDYTLTVKYENPLQEDDHIAVEYDFTVTITDEPPVAVCKDITINLEEDGTYENYDLYELINNGSYHSVCDDYISLSADQAHFSCGDIGSANLVTLNVYADNGTSDHCISNVTVEPHPDDLPIANCVSTFDIDLAGQSTASFSVDDMNDNSVFASCHGDISIDINQVTCADVGQVNVTLTITDLIGRSDACTTSVNVLDSGQPSATCVDSYTLVLNGNGAGTIDPVNLDMGSVSNNCTDLTWSADITDFDCDDVGENTVTMIVTDDYGRTSSCQTTVHIEETTIPVALCKDITVHLDENGSYDLDPSEIDNGSNAGCSTNLSASVNSFTCEDLGSQTVVLTVTSASNEQFTCESTVTILDTIAPIAGGPDVIYLSLYGGAQTIYPYTTQFYQASSDNCGLASAGWAGQVVFTCEDLDTEVTSAFAVEDESGNRDTFFFIVNLTNPPIYMNCADYSVELENDGTYTLSDDDISTILDETNFRCRTIEDFSPVVSQSTFDCDDIDAPVEVTVSITQYGETHSCQSTITIADDIEPYCGSPKVSPVAFLEGPFDSATGLMNDDLRQQDLIPHTSPFAGTNETVSDDVLTVSGNNAIVDWVLIELRDAADQSEIHYTKAALLQRDGDVVASDGLRPVSFPDATAGTYYISIKHRNHLGLVTANTYSVSATSISIDFSNGATSVYGTNSRINMSGYLCMYGADTDGSGAIDATDRSAAWNERNQNGYLDADCNLDGTVNATDRSSTWNNRNISGTLPD